MTWDMKFSLIIILFQPPFEINHNHFFKCDECRDWSCILYHEIFIWINWNVVKHICFRTVYICNWCPFIHQFSFELSMCDNEDTFNRPDFIVVIKWDLLYNGTNQLPIFYCILSCILLVLHHFCVRWKICCIGKYCNGKVYRDAFTKW